ncbi:hypothetical protein F5880DRAFT_1614393 [Lentinula raphanica]|nr:hypothetical protein F5880DRAFT_1614393 [Lentinula raphanica]
MAFALGLSLPTAIQELQCSANFPDYTSALQIMGYVNEAFLNCFPHRTTYFGQERCIDLRHPKLFLLSDLYTTKAVIFTTFKGKFGQSGPQAKNPLDVTASEGASILEKSWIQPPVPSAKPSFRSTCWDLSDHVLSTLNSAAQYAPVPYLASMSAVALSILKSVQGAKENQAGLGELAKLACDLASSVLSTYQELHPTNPGSDTSQDQSLFHQTLC